MDIFDAIKNRRSIHHFIRDEISDEMVKTLLESAHWAPTAGNLQPCRFIVVKKTETIEKLISTAYPGYSLNFLREASVVIIVCADESVYDKKSEMYKDRGPSLFCLQDTAAAIENILLTAVALGLGACWVGAYYEEAVKQHLNIPEGVRPVALVPIGRTRSKSKPPPKRALEELISYETYKTKKTGVSKSSRKTL
ncbi:nitroreductase family protein [Candidatus Dependentiae bacterium]|nr:nitroreductase family protein [Candidatus Dependentiae bacterium]